ncbi:hypothetical protein LUZ60_001186 [Juncus effusus]|nr:hypothetical protein LUZ60_001186 [Juncus effusus]
MSDEKQPSGCAMFNMFRRRRSASATSIPRFDPEEGSKASLQSSHSMSNHTTSMNSHTSSMNNSSMNNYSNRRPPQDSPLTIAPPLSLPPALPQAGNETSLVPARHPVPQKPMSRRPPEPKSPASGYTGLAAELDRMIHDRSKVKGGNGLLRATSGNMMIHGNLGNLGGGGAGAGQNPSQNYLSSMNNKIPPQNGHMPVNNGPINNAPRPNDNGGQEETVKPELCRALSRRLDPEELKEMGNEEYKQGRFAEALAYYDRAIVMAPKKAAYWSNKAAALTGLGRLLEAVNECKEAVRIDPSYHRAHHRLASLYLRLGDPDKAVNHYKLSLKEASNSDIPRAQSIKSRIAKCNDARKLKEWAIVMKEANSAITDGADSAPQVYALQAEALIKMQRHDEAESVLIDAPKFDVNEATKFFGTIANAYFLMVQAQVDMAIGRFEEAVKTAYTASQIDLANREISNLHKRAKAVASARNRGNDHFKASRFLEACISYGEGLGHDPHNSVLLCNRAACQSKLGNYQKAIDDCNAALLVRPSYSKARLRRADCNFKMEKWEASIKDYEVLVREMPGNEEVSKALAEAEEELKKQQEQSEINDKSITSPLSPD